MRASERLAEIQARAEEATEGPWKVNGADEDWAVISSGPDSVFHAYSAHGICEGCECGDGAAHVAIGIEDAEFIAHARTDVPALVIALRSVLNVHEPVDALHTPTGKQMKVCSECERDGDWRVWPCLTVRAIENALKGAQP